MSSGLLARACAHHSQGLKAHNAQPLVLDTPMVHAGASYCYNSRKGELDAIPMRVWQLGKEGKCQTTMNQNKRYIPDTVHYCSPITN